ncbi:DEAD-domain-containing protein [Dissoconium aciculare CBS 342.82]|uniref:ATP-dependent RNA helicase n=1 Tax=Dissoconium aciculare CBS 342.82 TaxID=1314786 RepID=A0A6J3M0V0_9PEZI|nr:DEAD-domain-containing protein [Dissoconium aciculare CBS 342.82]KAF1821665.1 DEAD-domain-containing protein [Dissoconium aciculare CBS 342.82]
MGDDGMLLNFQLPSDAFTTPKAAFKGGSWKDRLTARKSAEWGRQKALDRAAGVTTQKPRSNSNHESSEHGPPPKRARVGVPNVSSKHKPGDFVSSLFTSNPTSTAVKNIEEPVADENDVVEPSNAPLNDELANFTSLGLSTPLASHLLRKLNIKAPTAIQSQAIKQLCHADTDAFIQAQTGSGKTLAYLLPIVERISTISRTMKESGEDFTRNSGLFAIVLAPTRELSKQISTVLEGVLSSCHWIVEGTVIGGEKKKSEKARLRKGVNILVATPGRLADHLNTTEVLDVSLVRWLVLDEGDRLMELGFEQDIQKIVSVLNLRARKVQEKQIPGLPERRTTVLCSATIKSGVEQLLSISLKDPVSIAVDPTEVAEGTAESEIAATTFSAPAQLKQSYALVPPKQRLVTLIALLKQTFKRKGSVMKTIVFISCADSVDFHFELLSRGNKAKQIEPKESTAESLEARNPVNKKDNPKKRSFPSSKIPQGTTIPDTLTSSPSTLLTSSANPPTQVFRLHGSLPQATRTSTLAAFAQSTSPSVLLCTDVASRGLDLPNIDFVIEYDPPFSKDEHLHRIGRTARAGRDGRALIFLMPGCEEGYVDILKEVGANLTRHDADELLRKGFSTSSSSDTLSASEKRAWEDAATELQLNLERSVLGEDAASRSEKNSFASNPAQALLLEQARRAYQSHIRAYATHVATERHIFDMKSLHLGHLAKAFALRDRPGVIRVPGLRPGEGGNKKDGKKSARRMVAGGTRKPSAGTGSGVRPGGDDVEGGETDVREAKRKMFARVKAMGGASEFNLG